MNSPHYLDLLLGNLAFIWLDFRVAQDVFPRPLRLERAPHFSKLRMYPPASSHLKL